MSKQSGEKGTEQKTEQLREQIRAITDRGAGVNLYFALKSSDQGIRIKRADLAQGNVQNRLKQQFMGILQENFVENEKLKVTDLSTSDDRADVFYRYDYEELPEKVRYFFTFDCEKGYETFSFKEDSLNDLEAYLIVLGNRENHCILYQRFRSVYAAGRKGLWIFQSEKRFDEFEGEVIRIGQEYQYIRVGDQVYIKDLNDLERFGGFHEVLKREAESAVTMIKRLDILADSGVLYGALKADVSFARKLSKIKRTSQVFQCAIPRAEIIRFSQTHPALAGKLQYSEAGDKILLPSKKSQQLFLKLLDDSYLVSELTKQYYDSEVKEHVV